MPRLPEEQVRPSVVERARAVVGTGVEATDGFSVCSAPQDQEGHVLVTASGDVDCASASLLGACLQTHLGSGLLTTVTVDLTGVAFLNAAGLAVLARAHQLATARGVHLVVRCGSEQRTLLRLLACTGLDEALAVVVVDTA